MGLLGSLELCRALTWAPPRFGSTPTPGAHSPLAYMLYCTYESAQATICPQPLVLGERMLAQLTCGHSRPRLSQDPSKLAKVIPHTLPSQGNKRRQWFELDFSRSFPIQSSRSFFARRNLRQLFTAVANIPQRNTFTSRAQWP